MPATLPQALLDIVSKRAFAHLTTLNADGSPQASPVWVDTIDSKLRINTARGRIKDRNMRKDPRVAISITDPDDPYRAAMIRGEVVRITEEGADAHIDALAKKYMGVDTYPLRAPGEVRVIVEIAPTSVVAR